MERKKKNFPKFFQSFSSFYPTVFAPRLRAGGVRCILSSLRSCRLLVQHGSFVCSLNHILQIPFDGGDDLVQVFCVVSVRSAARADLQGVVRAVLCEKLVVWDLGR